MLPIKMHRCPITNLEIINQEVRYDDDLTETAYYYRVKYKSKEYYLGLCLEFYNLLINPKDKDTDKLKELYQKLPLMFVDLNKVEFEPFFNSRLHWDCPKINSSRHKQFYIKSFVDDLIQKGHTIPSNEEKLKMVLEKLRNLEKFPGDVINIGNSFELWTKCYMANEREFKTYLRELHQQNKIEYVRDRVRLRLDYLKEKEPDQESIEATEKPAFFKIFAKPKWYIPAIMMLLGVFIFTPLREKIFPASAKSFSASPIKKEISGNGNLSDLGTGLVDINESKTVRSEQKAKEKFFNNYTLLKDHVLLNLKEQIKSPKLREFHLISEALQNTSELHKEVNYALQNKLYPEEKHLFYFDTSLDSIVYQIKLNGIEVFSSSILDTLHEEEFKMLLKKIIADEIDNINVTRNANDTIR